MRRAVIRVTGTVQGVGFRPFVHRLADELGLTGYVGNDLGGVFIEVQGEQVGAFLRRLRADAPAICHIDSVTSEEVDVRQESGFRIVSSQGGDGAATTSIPADAAVCQDCLAEMRDPLDRRFDYPFIACTNCGPRYTMVTGLPYDRANTAMADFPLCAACEAEYRDPRSRRYHAQPTACGDCGPRLSMPVADVAAALRTGRIVAIKGVGGYHLACDANSALAVGSLRERKQRGDKPFAVMVASLGVAQAIADIDQPACDLLESGARPIVLLPSKDREMQAAVAPGNDFVGVMLPYTRCTTCCSTPERHRCW